MPFLVFGPMNSSTPLLPELTLIAAVVVLGFLGYAQALVRCRERQIPREDARAKIGPNVLAYLLLQILFAPLLWAMVAFARCASDGFGI